MSTRRIVSLLIAAIVAMLVVYAGKSCAENIAETNKQNSYPKTAYTGNNDENLYDSPGIGAVAAPTSPASEYDEDVETVTNIFGNIIGTVPHEEDETETPENNDSAQKEEDNTRSIFDKENNAPQNGSQHSILGESEKNNTSEEEATAIKDLNELTIYVD